MKLNFEIVKGWSFVFVLFPGATHSVAFAVYVDDLIMVGTDHLTGIITEVRKNIRMEGPTDVQKYLGCVHHIAKRSIEGKVITEVTFDMVKYFEAREGEHSLRAEATDGGVGGIACGVRTSR